MIVLRLLLRFILVPFGALMALAAATALAVFGNWDRLLAELAKDPTYADNVGIALLLFAPVMILLLTAAAFTILMPASLGALIAEVFAFRSWLFHVGNGVLSAGVGWVMLNEGQPSYLYYGTPLMVFGAGIVAGFAYWLVAGWSAGFWKPVFGRPHPLDAVGSGDPQTRRPDAFPPPPRALDGRA